MSVNPASLSTAAKGAPVHSAALRIIASCVLEGLGAFALEVLEIGGVAAGALHHGAHRAAWVTAQLLVVDGQRVLDLAVDG